MQFLRKVWARIRAVLALHFGIQTWADVRNIVHLAAPSLALFLVGWNLLDADKAKLIGALVAAVASPLLSLPNTPDKWRQYLYAVLAAGQPVMIGVLGMTDNQVTPIVGAVLAVFGGIMSSNNTPISGAGLQGKPGQAGLPT